MTSKPPVHQDTSYTWDQLSLLPFEVIEISLRIGIVAESDHLQWQWEVRDPSARALLGMLSSPHVSASQWPRHAEQIMRDLHHLYEIHVLPF